MRFVIKAMLIIVAAVSVIVTVVVLSSMVRPRIYYAAKYGDTNALQRYINSGGDVNQRIRLDKAEPTLLIIAIWNSRVNAVELLLNNNADPNFIANGWDCNPLVSVINAHEFMGSNDPNVHIMELLLAHGANPNLTDPRGSHCPALYNAAEYGNTEAIKLLLATGANVNATNSFGQTPLHIVANVEAARLLIAAGASCKALSYGETPADVALRDRRSKVYEFLSKESEPYTPTNALEVPTKSK